LSWFKVFIVM